MLIARHRGSPCHQPDYLTVESSGDGAHSRLTHGSERGKDHNDNGSTR